MDYEWGWLETNRERTELFLNEELDRYVVDANRRAMSQLLFSFAAPRCGDREAVWLMRKINKKGKMSTGWSFPSKGEALQLLLGLGIEGPLLSYKLYEERKQEAVRDTAQKNLRRILGEELGCVDVLRPEMLSPSWLWSRGASEFDTIEETLRHLIEGGVLRLTPIEASVL